MQEPQIHPHLPFLSAAPCPLKAAFLYTTAARGSFHERAISKPFPAYTAKLSCRFSTPARRQRFRRPRRSYVAGKEHGMAAWRGPQPAGEAVQPRSFEAESRSEER